ncbi:MAG: hypothetical protein M0D55_14175 [Elusimicrobiota bacterium]|nr:MAG: hypothetical protein M0D55_14175 [Elusimicrobiota bacterium]
MADGEEAVFAAQENDRARESAGKDREALLNPAITKEDVAKIRVAQEARAELIESNARKFPESFPVQQTGAAAAIQAGDWKRGEQYATKALSLAEATKDPQKIGDALQTRAIGALQAGDFAKAEADSKRLLEMRPTDKNARMLYESSKGRAKGAAPTTTAAAPAGAVAPWPADVPRPSPYQDPRVVVAGRRALDRQAAIKRVAEAMEHFNAGRHRESIDSAEAAQRHDPTFADAHMQKSLAWATLNDLAKALLEVTKAIGLWTLQGKEERLPGAYTQRALLQNELKDYPTALADAEKALAYNPAYGAAYLQRARAGEGMGKEVARALDDYKKAAELDPNFTAQYEAAVARLAMGGSKAAKAPETQQRDWLRVALAVASAFFVFFSAWCGASRGAGGRRRTSASARSERSSILNTTSSRHSARAGWARCTKGGIRCSSAPSRSRSCAPSCRPTRASASAS